jgi:23S rRNA pseudouridine1911/1915/1917 synthase
MSDPPVSFTFRISPAHAGTRLDSMVAGTVRHCSRSFAAALIQQGAVTVDGMPRKASYLVKAGETVSGEVQPPQPPSFQPENIPLEILYEDAELLVVNKAPGMVVHPAPGHSSGTLVNALMHHCQDLPGISGSLRPGIVHRLDRHTSGALVVAKTDHSMHSLAAQFKAREVRKHYLALVYGVPASRTGIIDRPIGRHPVDRKKMSVTTHSPRPALTRWRVREVFAGSCCLKLDIRTGRTHQIRVHCTFIGHPIVGDPIYYHRGEKKRLALAHGRIHKAIQDVRRQMLHAWRLSFVHPRTGKRLHIQAPIPSDMDEIITRLRELSK